MIESLENLKDKIFSYDFDKNVVAMMLSYEEDYTDISLYDFIEGYLDFYDDLVDDYKEIINDLNDNADLYNYNVIFNNLTITKVSKITSGYDFELSINRPFFNQFKLRIIDTEDPLYETACIKEKIILNDNNEINKNRFQISYVDAIKDLNSASLVFATIFAKHVDSELLFYYLNKRNFLKSLTNIKTYAEKELPINVSFDDLGYVKVFNVSSSNPFDLIHLSYDYDIKIYNVASSSCLGNFSLDPVWYLENMYVDLGKISDDEIFQEDFSLEHDYRILANKLLSSGYGDTPSFKKRYSDEMETNSSKYYVKTGAGEFRCIGNYIDIEENSYSVKFTFDDDSSLIVPYSELYILSEDSENKGNSYSKARILLN